MPEGTLKGAHRVLSIKNETTSFEDCVLSLNLKSLMRYNSKERCHPSIGLFYEAMEILKGQQSLLNLDLSMHANDFP